MIALSPSKLAPAPANPSTSSSSSPPSASFFPNSRKPAPPPRLHVRSRGPRTLTGTFSKSSLEEDEWLKRLPDKTKPLYSHSLSCIEAWLRNMGKRNKSQGEATSSHHIPPSASFPTPAQETRSGKPPPPAHRHHCTNQANDSQTQRRQSPNRSRPRPKQNSRSSENGGNPKKGRLGLRRRGRIQKEAKEARKKMQLQTDEDAGDAAPRVRRRRREEEEEEEGAIGAAGSRRRDGEIDGTDGAALAIAGKSV
ncbi:serine/arginine repetitive matrix protein 1-like [Eucalyptus grandis]|uniref:serine/arginine repetitive matrix protein 1-like n=1 Tax=Eucalyptus grandis TaxID=71139 RepID=UPI00192EEBD9|nr:serine/arginine repetitive matrix protein 1-like [Eucalyptus grandis]